MCKNMRKLHLRMFLHKFFHGLAIVTHMLHTEATEEDKLLIDYVLSHSYVLDAGKSNFLFKYQ